MQENQTESTLPVSTTDSVSMDTSTDSQMEVTMKSSAELPLTIRQMLEAGVHFGHQTNRWNPKMKSYIFGARNGIHIIDLQQTVRLFQKAYNFLVGLVAKGDSVLFVGTKKQCQELVQQEAARAGMFHVTNRWLGGTLTNFKTVKASLDRLRELEKMAEDGTFERVGKKEVLMWKREQEKLEKSLGGIKTMVRLPGALFVVDAKKEHLAITEARKLQIPVVAIADTNADPDLIDFLIPGNDDALRAVQLIVAKMADGCLVGTRMMKERGVSSSQEKRQDVSAQAHGESGDSASMPKVETGRRRGGKSSPAAVATPSSVTVTESGIDAGDSERTPVVTTKRRGGASKRSS